MVSSQTNEFPVRVLLGVALLLGGSVLAWLSSVATLQLRKVEGGTVNVELSTRLFGLIPIDSDTITDVVSVASVPGRAPGSTSRSSAPNRLVFQTSTGRSDLGYDQQRFVRRYPAMRDFLADSSESRMTLTSFLDDWQEIVRFFMAQLGAVVLLVGGVLMTWDAFRRRRAQSEF